MSRKPWGFGLMMLLILAAIAFYPGVVLYERVSR